LDEKYNLAVSENQKVYTIFNSQEEAEDAAKKMLVENHNVEVVIYGKDQEVLLYLTPPSKEPSR
jgi:hypothetical protein